MNEKRKRERRNWRSKPDYPFFDSEGNWVLKNRRRVLDRRLSQSTPQSPAESEPKYRLRLFFQGKVKELSLTGATTLTLGRKPDCDIEVSISQASREHARIEAADAGFVLTDQSVNGTYLKFDDGSEIHLLKDSVALQGSGMMSLGKPILEREPSLIYFWCSARRAETE